jgi:hypothetical protein
VWHVCTHSPMVTFIYLIEENADINTLYSSCAQLNLPGYSEQSLDCDVSCHLHREFCHLLVLFLS